MSDHDKAVQALRTILPQYRNPIQKTTGYLDPSSGLVGADPTAGCQASNMWVHGYPRGANVQVIIGPINPYVPNVRVWVGTNPQKQRVAYAPVFDKTQLQTFPNLAQLMTPTTTTPGSPVSIAGLGFVPGRVIPSAQGGMFITVQSFYHSGGFWNGDSSGDDFDLTSAIPAGAGTAVWVVVYLDPVANALGTVAGAPQLAIPTGLPTTLITDIVLPAGVIPLAAILLTNGMTAISTTTPMIQDVRQYLDVMGSLLSGDSEAQTISAGAITTGNKSVIIVTPSSGSTDTLTTITLTGAPRELWLIAASGDTITLATGGNIAVGAVCTDTQAVLIYHNGTTAYVVSGGSGGDASTLPYTPANPSDWDPVPTEVAAALDTLAADTVTGGINKDLFTQTADVTVANTTTPTTLFGTGQVSSLLPANYFVVGRMLVIDLAGYRATALVAPNITFTITLGSTTICLTATFADVGSLSGQQWHLHAEITCRTTGGSGSVSAQGWVELNSTSTVAIRAEMATTSPVTLDTTVSQQAKALVTWGTASASNTITATDASLQTIDPNAGAGSGGSASLLLDYAASTDIFTNTSLSSATWTDIGVNQSFTVTNTAALIEFAVRLALIIQTASAQNGAVRLVIDSAGTPINVLLSSSFGLNNTLNGGVVKLSGLSAAAHTVKAQVYCTATATLNLNIASAPNVAFYDVQVTQLG